MSVLSQQTLCTFCTFTNADINVAKSYLIQTNWNLNQALNRYYQFLQHYLKMNQKSTAETQKPTPSFICSTATTNHDISANRTKQKRLTAFGFIRKYSIPSAISELICSFYFTQHYDAWCIQYIYSHNAAKINYDGTKLWISCYEVTLFSNHIVKMGEIHTFRLRILSLGQKQTNCSLNASLQPFIGIIKDDQDTLIQFRDAFDYWKVDDGYQFCCGKAVFRGNNTKQNYGTSCCAQGDVIEMRVDLIQWKLSFVINGADYGVACDNIDHSDYRLALSSVNIPAEFELF